jgi:RNA polymerase sigma-70 factor (ECF subfamily)
MREKEPSCSSVLPTTDFLFMSNFSTFECQVDTHEDRVYRIARSYLKDTPTAQDVTQEVLVKLWKHQEELDEDGLMAWLTCVTRNACIDKLRARQRRRKAVRVDADGLDRAESPDRTPDRYAETEDLRDHVLDALDRVDDPYREVVALRELQGLKYKEIAETLDMPLNTVKVYLHRGRKKLQAQLDRALDLAVA